MSHKKNIGLEDERLEEYVRTNSSEQDAIQYELFRQTHLKLYHPRRSTDHLSGLFLEMISSMLQPKHILEIGTFSGYGTICLARGLKADGRIQTIEVNDEMEGFIRKTLRNAEIDDQVDLHIGDAKTLIPSLPQTFDLVFMDAEKDEYSEYFDLVIDKVRPGGFILADNVLWSGKVIQEDLPAKDHFTKGILAFNKKIKEDPRVENLILPAFDGINIIKKK